MLDVFYIDIDPGDSLNGITTYTKQYLLGMSARDELNLNCIWLEAPVPHVVKRNINGINHFYLPKYSKDNKKLRWEEWVANLIIDFIITTDQSIIHINWISHCSIIKYLRWRVNCKILLTKHCILWRELITTDYVKFQKIDKCLRYNVTPPIFEKALLNEMSAFQYVDHIITVTEIARESLIKLASYQQENISVIRNGLDFKNTFRECSEDKTKLKKTYGFKKNDKLLLFVGTVSVKKGVSDLLEAFNLVLNEPGFENTKLIVAGKGDFNLLFKYTSITSKIIITGNLSKSKLSEFYKIADIGIIPSYVEQCSYTAIEMMYAGLPIVAANVDGLMEMITPDSGILVNLLSNPRNPSIDVSGLKNAIIEIYKNPNHASDRVHNACLNAYKSFSLPTMVDKIVSVYKRLDDQKTEDNHVKMYDYPMITVLLPVYNAQKYIRDCIESILAQTYNDFELIIIDDASTDNTNIIIAEYNDWRIKVVSNKSNRGIAYSLNKGLKKALGKYIARIDADDIMLPNRLHEQLSFLANNIDYGMVGSWYETIDEHGQSIDLIKLFTKNEPLKLLMLFANQFAHPTVMIRSSIVKDLKYRNKYKHCEDYDLWFRISEQNKVCNLPIVLTKYRIHGDNISTVFRNEQRRNAVSLIADKITDLGIVTTKDNLIIHAAIMNKAGINFFTKKDYHFKLNQWLDKILPALTKNCNSESRLVELRQFIVSTCCFNT